MGLRFRKGTLGGLLFPTVGLLDFVGAVSIVLIYMYLYCFNMDHMFVLLVIKYDVQSKIED